MNQEILKETLKNLSPVALRKTIRYVLKVCRDVGNKISQLESAALTEQQIIDALRHLNINGGDIVIVHSSLSRLGYVKGGSSTVISALMKSVGIKGTIGAPTYWGNSKEYLKGKNHYDVLKSQSILGAISEDIRKHPNSKRSYHPTHSAAFIGPAAEYLVGEHHLDMTPVGKRSPYRKLVDLRGKILLLGVTLEYMTNFHTIEDEISGFNIQLYCEEPIRFTVRTEQRQEITVITYCHNADAGKMQQCNKMNKYLLEYSLLSEAKLGKSTVMLLDAYLLHNALHDLYKRGITMYTPGY
jgi:aminoglycoside 3-N-acetyltransferase